jgi:hypothetical protein
MHCRLHTPQAAVPPNLLLQPFLQVLCTEPSPRLVQILVIEPSARKDILPHHWRATRVALCAMAASTQQTSALDEAIALIDSLCAKLRSEADDGAASSHAKGASGTTLQSSAPPVNKPWRTLASSRIPGDIAVMHVEVLSPDQAIIRSTIWPSIRPTVLWHICNCM